MMPGIEPQTLCLLYYLSDPPNFFLFFDFLDFVLYQLYSWIIPGSALRDNLVSLKG